MVQQGLWIEKSSGDSQNLTSYLATKQAERDVGLSAPSQAYLASVGSQQSV